MQGPVLGLTASLGGHWNGGNGRHRRLCFRTFPCGLPVVFAMPERFNHIRNTAYKNGAIPDQHVRARGAGVERVAGHCQHLAPLVEGRARGDERAGLGCCLDHHHGAGEPRDDPVAAREVPRLGGEPHGLFRQPEARAADLFAQYGIFGRIDHVDPARHNGGGRVFLQRGLVRRGVDAAGKAGYDGETRFGQFARQLARHPGAQRRGVAGPDQRHHGARQKCCIADHPKQGRGVGNSGKRCGIIGGAESHQPGTGETGGLDLGLDHGCGAGTVVFDPGGARHPGQRFQRRSGAAVIGHQPEKRAYAHAARAQEAEPLGLIFRTLGWGEGVGGRD